MARYGNFTMRKKRKLNKAVITAICVAVGILLVLFIIGVTTGSDSEGMARMSTAVQENTQLKHEIDELNAQIVMMQQEIDNLNAQLAARPAIEPVPEVTEPPAYEDSGDYGDDDGDYEPRSPRDWD